ncbi:MAG: hypothetical protein QXP44_00200 [Candidatus Bathyarchaeia archaeon]
MHADAGVQDKREAAALREVLEKQVVPTFYRRDGTGLPREWIGMMKHALASLAWRYNAARMVLDYAEMCYLPAAGANTSRLPDEADLDLTSIVRWLKNQD